MTIETLLPTPDIFSAKRILCVQPHYDDNDIAAAGILEQLQQNGTEIFYLTVTDDLIGVVEHTLSPEAAAEALKRDQFAAGKIIGVKEQYWLGYPDAGKYDYFDIRCDLLKYIRLIKPDFVFTPDPWLTYEGHRDHIQTRLSTAEAVMFAGLTKIAAVRCYQAQFEPDDMDMLVMVLDIKSRQVAAGTDFEHGEPLKALHPRALHCGF